MAASAEDYPEQGSKNKSPLTIFRKFFPTPFHASNWDKAEWSATKRFLVHGSKCFPSAKKELEDSLSAYFHAKGCGLYNSGRSAMYWPAKKILEENKSKQKSEALLPSYLCASVYRAFRDAGFSIRFVDISPDVWSPSAEILEKSITKKTGVVAVPHLFGLPNQEIAEIEKICKEKGISLFDDAAQCFGGEVGNKKVGSFGDFGILSFGSKTIYSPLGGAVIFNKKIPDLENPKEDSRITELFYLTEFISFFEKRSKLLPFYLAHSKTLKKITNPDIKYNSISQFDAKIASLQLNKVEETLRKRKHIAKILFEELEGANNLELPPYKPSHCFTKFVIKLGGKSPARVSDAGFQWKKTLEFEQKLGKSGFECEWEYVPLHLRFKSSGNSDLENIEKEWWRAIAIPCQTRMGDERAKELAQAVKAAVREIN